jgi:hypothetical protein
LRRDHHAPFGQAVLFEMRADQFGAVVLGIGVNDDDLARAARNRRYGVRIRLEHFLDDGKVFGRTNMHRRFAVLGLELFDGGFALFLGEPRVDLIEAGNQRRLAA